MHNASTGANVEITHLEANRVPTPISPTALADADTQPFQVIKRPKAPTPRTRFSRTHLSIAFGSVVSIVAAIFLVKSLTSATPSSPSVNLPTLSLSLIASPAASITPRPTQPPVTSTANTTTTPKPTSTSTVMPSPTATIAPSASPTDKPSATPTVFATAVSTAPVIATEPATTGVFTGELVKNGGFEDGDAHWYLDVGARSAGINAVEGQRALILPADNGYADQTVSLVPGMTYTLSASGMLGSHADTGEIGIRFTMENGEPQPLTDEPTLIFTGSSYSWQSLTFVVPDHVIETKLIIWKPSGAGIFAVDEISLRASPTSTGDGTD